jgi:Protein of unknown function (DUF1549)/Protein of unknown function (DUF1553)
MKQRLLIGAFLAAGIAGSGLWLVRAQDTGYAHPECTFFGAQRERFLPHDLSKLGATTEQVTKMLGTSAIQASTRDVAHAAMPSAPGGSRTYTGESSSNGNSNLIDVFIWQAFQAQGAIPAQATTDYEFVRRVTLDLTGRIPTGAAVNSFVADTTPNKRANLIDSLLASPQWIDKWTMFYGDLFKNASNWPSMSTSIAVQGRDAFNTYIRNALTNGTPYNKVASDLIGSQGTNNFTQGELNWMITGRVTGNGIPIQDTWDQQTADVADTFLGIAHMNCLLCHNGRGHLDSLSLWGGSFTRTQAWGFSSYLAHTNLQSPLSDPSNANSARLWYVNDAASKTDYALNTTTGNRPARQPIGTQKTVAPVYPFSGSGPNPGEGYRQAMARQVTSDFQFARAAVNYLWAAFFTVGLVDPPDQFDPARLDPNNPPPAPWTLQASNPDLLNALAADFVANNYDIKHTMRLIASSKTYQLESQYDPNAWNPAWQSLFARKLVRRLWGEEVADSIVLSSNIPTTYTTNSVSYSWAMQLPEPAVESAFMQFFLPGNRDDQPRRPDGAIQQALGLMNDNMVMSKLNSTGSGATQSLLSKALAQSDNNSLTSMLYINILSRQPTSAELQAANTLLTGGTRTQKAQELMWTLYNKVDFMFNY